MIPIRYEEMPEDSLAYVEQLSDEQMQELTEKAEEEKKSKAKKKEVD